MTGVQCGLTVARRGLGLQVDDDNSHLVLPPPGAANDEELRSSSIPEDQEEDKGACHLEAWTVSVADIGWDFIVFPTELNINFCVGACPPPPFQSRHNASTNAIARAGIKRVRYGTYNHSLCWSLKQG